MLAAENAPLFTQLVADNFDQSSRTFVAALRECLPELTADEILWRFHFMLGTIYYSASSPQRIKAFSRGRCDPGDLEAGACGIWCVSVRGVPVWAGHDSAPPPAPPRVEDQVAPMRLEVSGFSESRRLSGSVASSRFPGARPSARSRTS